MIIINKKNNLITIKGHANYSDGNDIVCAGISSVMYTTINAILKYDKELINYVDDKKIVKIEYKNNEVVNLLIENMMCMFKDIENSYPKNVKIETEE